MTYTRERGYHQDRREGPHVPETPGPPGRFHADAGSGWRRPLCYRPGRRPPIPVVALVNLLFGIGFALVARDRIRADGPFAAPAFHLVLLHAAAVVAPIALYFYAVHPAWAWMYWFDPKKVSGASVLPLMVGHATLVVGGWYGASVLLRRGYQGALLYVAGAIALVLLILIVSGIKRLSTAAEYATWQADKGVSVFEVQVGWAFVVSLLALFFSAIYIAIELGRDGRRVRSR